MHNRLRGVLLSAMVILVVAFGIEYFSVPTAAAQLHGLSFVNQNSIGVLPNVISDEMGANAPQSLPMGSIIQQVAKIYPNTTYVQVPMVIKAANTSQPMVAISNTPCGTPYLVPASQEAGVEESARVMGNQVIYNCPMMHATVW